MPWETIDEYEIEYSGHPLAEGVGWGAFVTVYGPSPNPMHRNSIYPMHRVAADMIFPSEQAAQIAARKIALELLAGHHARHL